MLGQAPVETPCQALEVGTTRALIGQPGVHRVGRPVLAWSGRMRAMLGGWGGAGWHRRCMGATPPGGGL